MDIYADDDAGNTAYMATMLWAVTTDNLCVNVRMVRMSGVARDSGVLGVPRMQRYRAQTGESVFYGIPKMTKYSASVVRCELCGRW